MPDTEYFHTIIGKAETEIEVIHEAARRLSDALHALVNEFCEKHDADKGTAYGYLDNLISDLVFDAVGPAERRKTAAENEIAVIEDADLRRSSPVVL